MIVPESICYCVDGDIWMATFKKKMFFLNFSRKNKKTPMILNKIHDVIQNP